MNMSHSLLFSSQDPDQMASSESSGSGSTLFVKQDISMLSRTRVIFYSLKYALKSK